MPLSYWDRKIVAITGGSSGLGLHLAQKFAQQGARLILIGRRIEPLQEAAQQLSLEENRCRCMVGDVTVEDEVQRITKEAVAAWGGLNVWVNNAGRSDRGNLLETDLDSLRELIELNALAAIRCAQLVSPALIESKGHLIQIGSLASKVGGPHLGGYPASKFALAGATQQLRLELGEKGVHVLLVCPGPIRRDDAGTRYDEQTNELPESARQPGAGVNLKGIDPERLVSLILQATEKRSPELVIPFKAKLLFAISALFPGLGDWILRKQFK